MIAQGPNYYCCYCCHTTHQILWLHATAIAISQHQQLLLPLPLLIPQLSLGATESAFTLHSTDSAVP